MCAFSRKFTRINEVKSDPLFKKHLRDDIKDGEVFPAVRDGYMCFYCGGSRPFVYDQEFSTHKEYISLLVSDKDYLTEEDLKDPVIRDNFCKCYNSIIKNCQLYSGVEAQGVSNLYSEYSYVNNDKSIVVLDIEVSFKNENKNYDKKLDRIDILLFSINDKSLKFVEAKDFTNSEIWSKEGTKPKVVNQIKRYNEQIKIRKNKILAEYSNYIDVVNNLFDLNLPYPREINLNCGLYIFGFDRDEREGRFRRLIKEDGSFDDIEYYPKGDPKNVSIKTLWDKVTM